jgi:cysteine-rich repeat protein
MKKFIEMARITVIFCLLISLGCERLKNEVQSPEILKAYGSGFRTSVEESNGANTPLAVGPAIQGQPGMGPLNPPPGPFPLPPLVDPLTGGPALPPPPPIPGDDDVGERRAIIIIPPCARPVLTVLEITENVFPGACKDGNTISGDGCSDICLKEYCGNGYVEPEHGEECDSGQGFNVPQAVNCDKFCRLIICGNGRVELAGTNTTVLPQEECDLGLRNGGCSGCTTTCQLVVPCATTADCTCTLK